MAFQIVASNWNVLLFVERHIKAQAAQDQLEHDKEKLPGFISNFTGVKGTFFYAGPTSQKSLLDPNDERGRLAKTMKTEEVSIPLNTLSIGSRYLHLAVGKCLGKESPRCHMYLISEEAKLIDAIASAYCRPVYCSRGCS